MTRQAGTHINAWETEKYSIMTCMLLSKLCTRTPMELINCLFSLFFQQKVPAYLLKHERSVWGTLETGSSLTGFRICLHYFILYSSWVFNLFSTFCTWMSLASWLPHTFFVRIYLQVFFWNIFLTMVDVCMNFKYVTKYVSLPGPD